jgi:predicted TIM-barrel fold metal-dependent hydrolase
MLVDVHVHLFSADPARFPYPTDAPYRPKPSPLEDYVKVVAAARVDHTVIVHPRVGQATPVPVCKFAKVADESEATVCFHERRLSALSDPGSSNGGYIRRAVAFKRRPFAV